MRHRYIVAYDVSDAKRLRRVHRTCNGYGDALQYSVFLCSLSDVEKLKLVEALSREIHHVEDRVVLVDIGPVGGRAELAFEYLGRREEIQTAEAAVIV